MPGGSRGQTDSDIDVFRVIRGIRHRNQLSSQDPGVIHVWIHGLDWQLINLVDYAESSSPAAKRAENRHRTSRGQSSNVVKSSRLIKSQHHGCWHCCVSGWSWLLLTLPREALVSDLSYLCAPTSIQFLPKFKT